MGPYKTEFDQKQERIQALLSEHGLDGLLLQRVSSFAWATCGAASYVNTAASTGEASLLITNSHRYVIANNIEFPRLMQDNLLDSQGWEYVITPWHEGQDGKEALTRGLKLGTDGDYPGAKDLTGEMSRIRAHLTPEEGEKFQQLGRLCAEAMRVTVKGIHPGLTEYEIAGLLAGETEKRGVQVVVNLVATDERIFKFRHPLPTSKALDRYAMLVLCGRRDGLVCSITRLVHFGSLPDEVRRKAEAVARVDAAFIDATRPGRRLGEVFQIGVDAYAENGYPGEWELHHQGGPAGYEPREIIAVPGSTNLVKTDQVYAWNPSITGTKSEDTILIGEDGNEVLTNMEDWPVLTVKVNGQEITRPTILEMG
jgi:antitoxin VapB